MPANLKSHKALSLALKLDIFNEKGIIPGEEEKLPVDVRGSKTSMLTLSNSCLLRTEELASRNVLVT